MIPENSYNKSIRSNKGKQKMELKVDNFTIQLLRAEETSHEEEVKRLATYVSLICELGQKQKNSSRKK